jgi:hypothetical protein
MKPYVNDVKLYIDTNTKEYTIINQDGEILYEADINTMKTTYISSDYKRYKRHLRRLVKITKILQIANEKITARYLNEKR